VKADGSHEDHRPLGVTNSVRVSLSDRDRRSGVC